MRGYRNTLACLPVAGRWSTDEEGSGKPWLQSVRVHRLTVIPTAVGKLRKTSSGENQKVQSAVATVSDARSIRFQSRTFGKRH